MPARRREATDTGRWRPPQPDGQISRERATALEARGESGTAGVSSDAATGCDVHATATGGASLRRRRREHRERAEQRGHRREQRIGGAAAGAQARRSLGPGRGLPLVHRTHRAGFVGTLTRRFYGGPGSRAQRGRRGHEQAQMDGQPCGCHPRGPCPQPLHDRHVTTTPKPPGIAVASGPCVASFTSSSRRRACSPSAPRRGPTRRRIPALAPAIEKNLTTAILGFGIPGPSIARGRRLHRPLRPEGPSASTAASR